MTPVMARCSCVAAYPLAECTKCTPTPSDGRNPDHRQPIRPLLPRAPADDHGLTVDHGDTQTVVDLAALAVIAATAATVLTGAAVGGSVLHGFGLLERLLKKLP